jgi:hypothetical protein
MYGFKPTLALFLLVTSSMVLGLPMPTADSSDDGSLCLGSSFSPTNCDSPGADSITLDPTVDVSPTIEIRDAKPDPTSSGLKPRSSDCIGSSFSPTNCDSPGADSINVDPDIDISPDVDLSGVTDTVDDVVNDLLG